MSKKVFATIGMIVCVLFVVMGFVTIGRDNSCSKAYQSGMYDSGFATFGADYYTYSSNNAAETANAARTTANNIYQLYNLLTDVFGWFFVFSGLAGFCHFGVICADCKDAAVSAAPAAVEESASVNSEGELKN